MIPTIENVKVQDSNIDIHVSMVLASIPVSVRGMYLIRSNAFYPSVVTAQTDLEFETPLKAGDSVDLEEFCDLAGWDYFDTHELIQEAVERRYSD